jgi:hypothetical protein
MFVLNVVHTLDCYTNAKFGWNIWLKNYGPCGQFGVTHYAAHAVLHPCK